jgi:hypothetical protein
MEFDTVLEVRRTQIEYDKLKAQIEQNVEQRYHWRWQRGFWVLTVVLAVCATVVTLATAQ